jgi:hypothetical protein
MTVDMLGRLRRHDDERTGIPGEHWYALAAGLWLMTRGRDSALLRTASLLAGLALVARAASGRHGLVQLLPSSHPRRRAADRADRARSHERPIDIAAPWPYGTRVRVAAITQPLRGAAFDAG